MALIAIDWDGTIVDSDDRKRDPKLLVEAKEAIGLFRERGHKVTVFSANRPLYIQRWLNEWGIPVDAVYDGHGKLNADIFVDDKAYHFPHNASWEAHMWAILNDPRVLDKDNRRW